MEPIELHDDARDRVTFPAGSAHRMRHDIHNPNWAAVAVWTFVCGSAIGTAYLGIRIGMLAFDFITLHWLR